MIRKTLFLLLSICGEPSVVNDKLLCIGYDTYFNAYFIVIDLEDNSMEQMNLNWTATLGFHSIFIN